MNAFFFHLALLSAKFVSICSSRVNIRSVLLGQHDSTGKVNSRANATEYKNSHPSDVFNSTAYETSLRAQHQEFSKDIELFKEQLHRFQREEPQVLRKKLSLEDIVQDGSLQKWLEKIDGEARSYPDEVTDSGILCLDVPSDALCSHIIKEKCSKEDEDDEDDVPPPHPITRMPYDAFTAALGILPKWERGFKEDADLASIITHFHGPAVGMVKAGFTGMFNVLLEQSQWVNFAGNLGSTDSSFRAIAAGPHGPLYLLLKDSHEVSSNQDSSNVLTPSDWYMALLPEKFYTKLIYALDLAINLGLMLDGTQLKEEQGAITTCHQLNYPETVFRPAASMRICSYPKYANELRIKDLEKLGEFEVIDDVRITQTSALDSEDLGVMAAGQKVEVHKVVHVGGDALHIRGCIERKPFARRMLSLAMSFVERGESYDCAKWISLAAVSDAHMYVARPSEDDFNF